MKKTFRVPLAFLFIISLVACNLPQSGPSAPTPNLVGTTIAKTYQALTQASTPSEGAQSSPTVQTPLATPTLPAPTATATLLVSLTPTVTLAPSNTPIPQPGTIAGSISGYPYGSLPALTIVAYGQNAPYYYSFIITGAGSAYYSMSTDYLIPGPFQVVAYDASGHNGGCPGLATVISNQTVTCNITDWSNGYRAKPSSVPGP